MNTNTLSRLFGKFAAHEFPAWFQRIVNMVYVRIFKIDLTEFAPLESYPSLNALFTRTFKVPRTIESNPKAIISPSDSLITEVGVVTQDSALQIKGMAYSVSELLIKDMLNVKSDNTTEGFGFVNLYLSPSDYHHYHTPCDLDIVEARYFGGELLPVNMSSLRKNQNLFVRNERVVLVANTVEPEPKRIYFVAVGALNVGKMVFHFEPRIQTNAAPNATAIYTYSTPIRLQKGDEIGYFQMGSTIVLIAQDICFDVHIGQKVRFGEKIAMLDSRQV